MSKFLQQFILCCALLLSTSAFAQQVPNRDFEDWSGEKFNDAVQPKSWHASNVEQVGLKFNFAHQEAGHSGNYCMMVQDQEVGLGSISETSPGYFSLGQPWAYLPSITQVNKATAGTYGGINWTYRPDSMAVWIRRTGDDWTKEDFYLLYYSWSGTAVGNSYKNKERNCTSVTYTDEESDIRQAVNGNECGTATKATQIAEGMWRERKQYKDWTKITVPILYMEDDKPTKMNIIFSASNYPNFRANDGLYPGNSLYVDDIEMIYASTIQKLYVGDVEWKGFDPASTEIQYYALGETATAIPSIEAIRGAGSITNAHGTTVSFRGRKLSGSEISIVNGDLENTPTTITVTSEDGKSVTTYKIQFQRAASSNAKLAGITVNGEPLASFSPNKYNYNIDLPYGTTTVPVVDAEKQEDKQTLEITQPGSLTGTAKIIVTAANGTSKATYTLNFKVGLLADNTLADIKVNGKSIPGFTPSQAVYKVSLPVGTTQMPTVEGVSAYPAGEQTITYTAPAEIDGGTYLVSVTTPGNSVAKVYKLNFRLEASSYTYLKELHVQDANGTEFLQDFAPEKTTYYVRLPLGTTSMPTISYVAGDEYQTIKKEEGGIDGTTRITVTAGNGDQAVYKINLSTEKSDNSSLKGILIGGEPLEGFSPDQTSYSVTLPIGTTTLPEISVVPGDEYQQPPVITTAGVNGTTRITVTAGDGSITIYQITFKVEAYTDNTLKNLAVEGYSLQNAEFQAVTFDPQVNEYWVKLNPEATSLPNVTVELQNVQYQDTTVRRPSSLNGDYKITVRPLNGSSRQYVIHFVFKQSDNTALSMIYLDGQPLEGFAPEKTEYTYTLEPGATELPDVTAEGSEASQNISVAWDGRTVRITVKAQSGAKRVYKIKFIVPSTAGAQLEMIYVDGKELAGFKKDVLEYTYDLVTPTCPAITVSKSEGQQVTITAPYAAGKASIVVLSDQGETNTYWIYFVTAAAESVRLNDIIIGGQSLRDKGIFDPMLTDYEWKYEGALPTIGYEISSASGKVEILWNGAIAYLYVSDDAGNTALYNITFTRTPYGTNTLKGIYADGKLIAGFAETKQNYTFHLNPGSSYPVVTYQAKDESEVVFFGQTAEGVWSIVVEAENGDRQTYTVQYIIDPYDDATLSKLLVDGALVAGFAADKFEYNLTIDDGASLPVVTVEAREGQNVLIHDVSETEQQVLVYAESGANNKYTITYKRVLSNNALLADILIDGVSLEGFVPDVYNYIDTLDRFNEENQKTRIIPNIFPVGQISNQTITTYFCRPDGTAHIEVVAQDGETKTDYYIAFPVRKSANNALEDITLITEYDDLDFEFKANKTDYTVIMPYSATACPNLKIEKQEDEQRVDIISRPMDETTQVIVYAENGDKRTYSILFQREVLKTKNQLTRLYIQELDEDLLKSDKTKRTFDITVPYGTRALNIEYDKSYEAQTVFIEPGGVNHKTYITVKANNGDVADEIYTINPILETADRATLTDITVNGTTIKGFDPEQFAYIVEVEDVPVVDYTVKDGAKYKIIEQTNKHLALAVSYGDRTNTYHVWYYYKNDVIPNSEFNEWSACKTLTSAQKPSGWYTIADVLDKHSGFGTFTPNTLVSKPSAGIVELQTQYSVPGGGMIPGFITLGNVTGNWGVAGSSNFAISGGIPFHNSPDEITFNYKLETVSTNNQIQYILTGSDGTYTEEWNESGTSNSYKNYTYSLENANKNAGDPTTLNILINSYKQVSGTTVASGANMLVERITVKFNHTLKSMTVNGLNAAMDGNAFDVTLKESESIERPILSFTGEVRDQAQTVVWNDTTVDGEYEIRTASIRNFAENGADYTDYTLTVRRPLDSVCVLQDLLIDSLQIKAFDPEQTDYTVVLPASSRRLPDILPVPASSLQTVITFFNQADTTMTIQVAAEKGQMKTYTVKFTTELSNDTRLKDIQAEGVSFNKDTREYEVEAEYMPLIAFERLSDLQKVDLVNGVLTVTAENGEKGTYTIKRVDPFESTTGVIDQFVIGTQELTDFGGSQTDKEAGQPKEAVLFTRAFDRDSVVFVQTMDSMVWQVYGTTDNKTYKWTYPTSLSTNTDLAGIALNGVVDEHFNASTVKYTYTSDTTLIVAFEPADDKQTLTTEVKPIEGGVEYTTTVTAQSGASKKYTVTVRRPLSDISTLAGILLDGEPLAEFDPEQKAYTIILPLPADGIKREQPKMPSITYLAGQQGQTIEVTTGEMNGDETIIKVQSEDGDATHVSEYSLTVNAEPSHCVDLTGILVNGVPVQGEADEQFEPGRHYYSLFLPSNTIDIDYTTADAFQDVTITPQEIEADSKYRYILHVVAEDGVTEADYQVNIYIENKSSDDQLANILLNGKPFEQFEPAYNKDLVFDPGQNSYKITLAPGAQTLPEVNAVMKMEGQSVETTHQGDSIILTVTAVAGNKNAYVLSFVTPLSTNSSLRVIEANNEPIEGFAANKYFYSFDLKAGASLPTITVETDDENATYNVETTHTASSSNITITVTAEDPSYTTTYTVLYHFIKSDVTALEMIMEDGRDLPGFDAAVYYYTISLPVGTTHFPELDYELGEEHQTVQIETVSSDALNLVRQLVVTAQNGSTATYTVAYTILQSSVDTLQTILVEKIPLAGFKANVYEYYYSLSAQEAAERTDTIQVEPIAGDEYQTVKVAHTEELSISKSIGYKTVITATAPTGAERIYTIHYPVEPSDVATLKMIYLGGQPLNGFDEERFTYREEIGQNDPIPAVTVTRQETAQTVDIQVLGNIVTVAVTAENGTSKQNYVLTFERRKSDETKLKEIILTRPNGTRLSSGEFPYRPDYYEYTIDLDFDGAHTAAEQVPTVEYVKYEEEQQVATQQQMLQNGDIRILVVVTAANNEDESEYALTFHFLKPGDAQLLDITLGGESLEDFAPLTTDYNYIHPYGSTEADFFTLDEVAYVLSDEHAKASLAIDEDHTIAITVVAQNEVDEITYFIRQTIALDNDNYLDSIKLVVQNDTVMIRDFDPETLFYTYLVVDGKTPPAVMAWARSENADVSIREVSAGDTCMIIVTAQDQSVRRYRIHFAISQSNAAQEQIESDVLIKRIPGTNQLFVATLRNDVYFVLFDYNGHVVFDNNKSALPVADPNDAVVSRDAEDREVLNDVTNLSSGVTVNVVPMQYYFYTFFKGETKLKSGKMLLFP